MQLSRYRASSGFFGYELGSAAAGGAMRGPPLLTRIDFAPSIAAPSSHFLATATPSFLFSASISQMFRGALFEMWWHLVPVVTCLFAIRSSQRFPAVLDGSNSVISWVAPSAPVIFDLTYWL